ncbi:helix-turn-helix transcriptional regulator [Variovorax ureilyticus]|uniref:helix-turn-helix transcriptional regulator n=1 Tax=Variovorax ureilyticus TaxID=1836198 RepID=UPI003D66C189
MSEAAILQRLDKMTAAVVQMAKMTGARLTRAQMLERLGVSSNTFTARVRSGQVPKPCSDGKWLLSEVIEWESRDVGS